MGRMGGWNASFYSRLFLAIRHEVVVFERQNWDGEPIGAFNAMGLDGAADEFSVDEEGSFERDIADHLER
jgi:hypothetical protein